MRSLQKEALFERPTRRVCKAFFCNTGFQPVPRVAHELETVLRKIPFQIDLLEFNWEGAAAGRVSIQSNDVEALKQRQQALAKTPSDSCNQQ